MLNNKNCLDDDDDATSSAAQAEPEILAHTAELPTLSRPPETTSGPGQPCYERGLLRLVDDLDKLLEFWEREPLLTTGIGSFNDIISTAAVQRLLQGGLPITAVRLFDRGTELPSSKLVRPMNTNARGRQPVADLVKVSKAVARGATLSLHELHTFSPEVADFAELIARQTGYQVYCWTFLTPPHSRGVDPHVDKSSIFMCQVEGSKRWRISRPLNTQPGRDWRQGDGAVEVLDVLLREGDCLYLPRGFVHVGETEDDASVHLTLSVDTLTWAIVLQQALKVSVAESELLGQMTPPLFDQRADRTAMFEQRRELFNRCLVGLRYSEVETALLGDAPSVRPGADILANALIGRSAEGRAR